MGRCGWLGRRDLAYRLQAAGGGRRQVRATCGWATTAVCGIGRCAQFGSAAVIALDQALATPDVRVGRARWRAGPVAALGVTDSAGVTRIPVAQLLCDEVVGNRRPVGGEGRSKATLGAYRHGGGGAGWGEYRRDWLRRSGGGARRGAGYRDAGANGEPTIVETVRWWWYAPRCGITRRWSQCWGYDRADWV
jgi:hypothetical protein